MIPISDENPTHRPPIASRTILAANILVFLWQLSAGEQQTLALAFVPDDLFGALSGERPLAASTMVTSMFLHGGLMHLAGNMLYLWIFGNNVEDAQGHGRFVGFYLLCGLAAAATQAVINPNSTVPMVGASGAISGVLAAYVLTFPHARITVIIPLGILFYPVKVSALFVVGFWFVVQLFQAALTDPGEPGVAWWAHVGGFAAGVVLTPMMSRFPLYGRHRRGPWG